YYFLPIAAFVIAGMISSGIVEWGSSARPSRWPLIASAAALAVAAVVAGSARAHPPTHQVDASVRALFGPKTIVWTDISGGFYVLEENPHAAKLISSSPGTQDRLVRAVSDAGWTQLFT